MNKIEVLIKEVEQVPEPMLDEILDFVRFLKAKLSPEPFDTAIASEQALAKDWLTPEEEEAWRDL